VGSKSEERRGGKRERKRGSCFGVSACSDLVRERVPFENTDAKTSREGAAESERRGRKTKKEKRSRRLAFLLLRNLLSLTLVAR